MKKRNKLKSIQKSTSLVTVFGRLLDKLIILEKCNSLQAHEQNENNILSSKNEHARDQECDADIKVVIAHEKCGMAYEIHQNDRSNISYKVP